MTPWGGRHGRRHEFARSNSTPAIPEGRRRRRHSRRGGDDTGSGGQRAAAARRSSADASRAGDLADAHATEQAFIQAVVDTFIPADGLSPSGTECGVAVFIDRQLAGGYGNGARFYRSGPFLKGKPEHGYQLADAASISAQGIAETNAWSRKTSARISTACPRRRTRRSRRSTRQGEFAGLNGKGFFEALLHIAMEGFFSDPIYGGNRDMVAWKMIGYPGLPATYADKIDQYRGKKYDVRAAVDRRLLVRETHAMAIKLKEVDAVMVGMGWTGSIVSRELTKAGLTSSGSSAAPIACRREDFALPGIRDELRYAQRQDCSRIPAMETVTMRHNRRERAADAPLGLVPARRRAWAVPARTGTARTGASAAATTCCAASSTQRYGKARSRRT